MQGLYILLACIHEQVLFHLQNLSKYEDESTNSKRNPLKSGEKFKIIHNTDEHTLMC